MCHSAKCQSVLASRNMLFWGTVVIRVLLTLVLVLVISLMGFGFTCSFLNRTQVLHTMKHTVNKAIPLSFLIPSYFSLPSSVLNSFQQHLFAAWSLLLSKKMYCNCNWADKGSNSTFPGPSRKRGYMQVAECSLQTWCDENCKMKSWLTEKKEG